MSATITRGSQATRSTLVGARLPKFAPLTSAAGAVVLALAFKFLFGWTGWLTSFFTAAALFLVVLSAWSFSVEGRRRAKDRLASTLIYACFVAAVVPLVLILAYIAQRGLPAFSATFFSHSMNGVGPDQAGGGLYHALVGTIEQVGLASIIALPIGIFTASTWSSTAKGRTHGW